MKVALVCRKDGFSSRWENYCTKNNLAHKVVDPYANDIIKQVEDCDIVMWHHHHASVKDRLFAKQLLFALEQSGKKVFPDFCTGWHFDDKLAQKYILEAIGAPLVPTYVFFDKSEALKWALSTEYPKVFKLRGGAGSCNVKLVHTYKEAKKNIGKAFGRGFKEFRLGDVISYQWEKYRSGRILLRNFINFSVVSIKRLLSTAFVNNKEAGYIYFQEFMPNNDHDIRVIVIGDRAFAVKRMCRKDDFRASGSGQILCDKDNIDERCVEMSFDVASKLGSQCMGFDWVFDSHGNPLIIEMGYGFTAEAYFSCQGYWTRDMRWHEGSNFDFCGWMVEDIINKVKSSK